MNHFVEKCLREWQRLHVPDAIANEMAADLDADLKEAQADNVTAEEVLGNGAFDARSFAASWAAERGVIPPAATHTPQRERKIHPAAIAALTIIALVAIVLVASAHSGSVAPIPLSHRPRLSQPPPGGFDQTLHRYLAGPNAGATLLLLVFFGTVLAALCWFASAGRRRRVGY